MFICQNADCDERPACEGTYFELFMMPDRWNEESIMVSKQAFFCPRCLARFVVQQPTREELEKCLNQLQ